MQDFLSRLCFKDVLFRCENRTVSAFAFVEVDEEVRLNQNAVINARNTGIGMVMGNQEKNSFSLFLRISADFIQENTGFCRSFFFLQISGFTSVLFKGIPDADIMDYISREEPYDKAGSYAIQGYFGRYIDHICGDYENVVGLPFYRIEPLIQEYI